MSVHRRVDAIGDQGLAWIDFGSDTTTWSKGVYDILGLAADDFEPSRELFMSFIHPEDRYVRAVLADLMSPTPQGRGETFFRVVRRDGAVRLVSLARPEASPAGVPAWVCLFDYSHYFDVAGGRAPPGPDADDDRLPSGLWGLYEPNGPFTLSPTASRILGVSRGERVTLPQLLRQVDEGDRDAVARLFDPAASSSDPVLVGFTRLDDRTIRQLVLSVTVQADPEGHRLGFWGMVTDRTEDAERETALCRTRNLFDACLSGMEDGLVLLDRAGRVELANGAARRLLRMNETASGLLWDEVPGLMGGRMWRAVQAVAEGGGDVQEECHLPGLGLWVGFKVTPVGAHILLLLRSRDEVQALKGVIADLTERCGLGLSAGQAVLWEFDPNTEQVWFSDFRGGPAAVGFASLPDLKARMSPDDAALVDGTIRTARADRQVFEIVLTVPDQDGPGRRFRLRGRFDEGGPGLRPRFAGVAVIADDAGMAGSSPVAPRPQPAASLAGVQVRAARGALRWSVRELAEHSDVSVATINRFEAGSKAVTARDSSVAAMQRVLLEQGVEFFLHGDRPAIAITPEAAAAAD